jgi:hypothetical protein
MNTIKYTNYNSLNIPQSIILTKNNKQTILNRIKYTNEYTTWYTINNINYA